MPVRKWGLGEYLMLQETEEITSERVGREVPLAVRSSCLLHVFHWSIAYSLGAHILREAL